MPIRQLTWGCQFKCGQQWSSKKKDIEKHEESCWKNPLNKSCLTCEHGKEVREGYDCKTGDGGCAYRECNNPNMDNPENFKRNRDDTRDLPWVNCSLWENKKP